jgi:hypothetical protein
MSPTDQKRTLPPAGQLRPANSNVPEPPMAPIKAPSYRTFPPPPKSNFAGVVLAGLAVAAALAALAFAYWWLK